MNSNEVIKKLQIKNGKLQVQIERLKLDKEEYYLDYLDLHQRIDKAIEKYEKCKEEDYCTLALDMYDILKGEDDEEKI